MGASVDHTRLRKDSAPVTTALGRFVGGRVPFAPGLLPFEGGESYRRKCQRQGFTRSRITQGSSLKT
jgi:hypothetical protein